MIELLDRVNDERGYPDPDEARLQRHRLGVFGRRRVRVFLKGLPTARTGKCVISRFLPPLIGTLFEMPDDRHIVELLIRRPLRTPRTLYLEFEDTHGHYFSQTFEEIVPEQRR